MKGPKITYALSKETEKVVHIKNVQSGLACNCICIDCGENLQAVKGFIRSEHFRHDSNPDCKGGPETAIHLMAKQIIQGSTTILLPNNHQFEYSSVELERTIIEGVRSDVIIKNESNLWLVEIVVEHPLENATIQKIKKANYNCMEINLSKVDRDIDVDQLKQLVLSTLSNRKSINQIKSKSNSSAITGLVFSLVAVVTILFGNPILNWLKTTFKRKKRKIPTSRY